MTIYRPTWVEISKRTFENNVGLVKKKIGSQVSLLTVLKADGYGHHARILAPLALKKGAHTIGVSSLEEGLDLRESGISSRIFLLGGIYPFQNFSVAIKARLIPTVASLTGAQALAQLAKKAGRRVSFHLKVDTGMGRIGVSLPEAVVILNWVRSQPALLLEGVYSHFASADKDPNFTNLQLKRILNIRYYCAQLGFEGLLFHIANSAAILTHRESHLNMVRPGLILYGLSPFSAHHNKEFSPVLNWKSRVIFLKTVPRGTSISYNRTFITKRHSVIGTLPVGYADGIPRLASNKGYVLINGTSCPIVGRVTMDHIMVDVTGKRVKIGDIAVLIGRQGSQKITAHDWAGWAMTNPYEICCGISKRVPRVVVT